MSQNRLQRSAWDSALAWSLVAVWGSGFVATKSVSSMRRRSRSSRCDSRSVLHASQLIVLVTGACAGRDRAQSSVTSSWPGCSCMRCISGGSDYTQYLGMSAGITAVLLSAQPLLTALFAARCFGEKLFMRQWLGIAAGLAGVALVVWHKVECVKQAPRASERSRSRSLA